MKNNNDYKRQLFTEDSSLRYFTIKALVVFVYIIPPIFSNIPFALALKISLMCIVFMVNLLQTLERCLCEVIVEPCVSPPSDPSSPFPE